MIAALSPVDRPPPPDDVLEEVVDGAINLTMSAMLLELKKSRGIPGAAWDDHELESSGVVGPETGGSLWTAEGDMHAGMFP